MKFKVIKIECAQPHFATPHGPYFWATLVPIMPVGEPINLLIGKNEVIFDKAIDALLTGKAVECSLL